MSILLKLPEETIIYILSFLERKDILTCRKVCPFFNNVISNSTSLQYRIQLDVAGLMDGDPDSKIWSATERLRELKTFEHNWDHLQFRMVRTVPRPESRLYDMIGGYTAFGGFEDNPQVRGLTFVELPSGGRGTQERVWRHHDLGVDIRDFTMDPASDLLVLVEVPVSVGPAIEKKYQVNVHLRSMKTGKAHPAAANPIVSHTSRIGDVGRCGFFIRTVEDRLGLLFHPYYHVGENFNEDQLCIWNWKTGDLLSLLGPEPPDNGVRIESFLFLSPNHFIISRCQSEWHCTFNPCLDIYDFSDSPSRGEPKLIRRFQMPKLLESEVMVFSMLLRSDPAPDSRGGSALPEKRPFFLAPSSRLLTVKMGVVDANNRECNFMLFIHHSSLLNERILNDKCGDIVVPWQEWGSSQSRMLMSRLPFNPHGWVCYVYGNRFIRVVLRRRMNANILAPAAFAAMGLETILMIYDFNGETFLRDAYKARHSESDDDDPEGQPTIVTEPTIIESRKVPVFQYDVETKLPYRMIQKKVDYPIVGAMIDEECVVGCTPGRDEESLIFFSV